VNAFYQMLGTSITLSLMATKVDGRARMLLNAMALLAFLQAMELVAPVSRQKEI